MDRSDALTSAAVDGGGEVQVFELPSSGQHVDQVAERDSPAVFEVLRRCGATAIVGVDGGASLVAYSVMKNHGLKMPDDCSVIGIDLPAWSLEAREVNELACSPDELGEQAARMLAHRIDNPRKTTIPRRVLLHPEYRDRGSVGPAPG
jgi:DNA-binding LacI/PurR family transcriptional regulator